MGADVSSCGSIGADCSCACKREAEDVQVEAVPVMRRTSASTLELPFPNLCLSMSKFQDLLLMQTHEALRAVLLEPDVETPVHFISHEWLSFTHPDPQAVQLKRMQEVFGKFVAGEHRQLFKDEDWEPFLAGVSAGTSRAMARIEGCVTTHEPFTEARLITEVTGGCVWLDYHSIPQQAKDETFYKAVNSIPCYVERCDYFWVCAPSTMHAELQERRDFASWRRRGWCRLEETANFLSTNLKMPLVLTDQQQLSMYGFFDGLSMYTARPERSVFNGSFTCCTLDHKIRRADGSIEETKCDKFAIDDLLMVVFDRFLTKACHIQNAEDTGYRKNLILSLAQTFFAGDPVDEERWLPPADETLDECLARIGYSSLDAVDEVGWNPVVWILAVGSMDALRECCKKRPDLLAATPEHGITQMLRAVHSPTDRFKEFLLLHEPALRIQMINKATNMGITPIDRAAKHGFCANLKLLIESMAEIEPRRKDNGATPLLGAAAEHYPDCCRELLASGADVHSCDLEGNTALHLAVNPLTVTGNPEADATVSVISVLLQARANLQVRNHHGETPLDLAWKHHLCSDMRQLLEREVAELQAPVVKP